MKAEFFQMAFQELMKGVHTSVPGHILTFDPALQRAQVRIGIEVVYTNGTTAQLPPIADVPVLFLGGTQFTMTHQVNPGDEGLIVFSQRCVDGWKQTGAVANNPLSRFHDAHDAFFIPGFRPLPTRVEGFVNDGIRMQSRDGGRHVWIKASGEIIADNGAASVQITTGGDVKLQNGAGHIHLLADGTVNINGALIKPDGTIHASNVTFGGVSGKDHRHTGVQSGSQISGGPTN
ncbi:hypothetical protein KDH83_12880 [Achromobacter sp. Marseille-Q0513]|uniref:Gp138 family membrane-puncturing spike protein n=1 Tax=Achromobacter sp. Marseille-Q0513 TaxID=2829161 RepID=UPI001B9EAE64|nr:Gp138 family membrane-puncturing spike protein [Achromobacter sp. Marseille-Q0513]MBR8654188.1 hypothetical protein [Achromobacter sp. Marseille-Q0513]